MNIPTTLKYILIYSGIVTVLVLILNAFLCKWLREKNISDDFPGKMSIVYLSCLIIIIIKFTITDFDASGREIVVDSSIINTTNSDRNEERWTYSAYETSNNRILALISKNYLTVEHRTNKAYVSPSLWYRLDIAGKKELILSAVVYTDYITKEPVKFYDFYDKTSGKQIASWSTLSEFDFDY